MNIVRIALVSALLLGVSGCAGGPHYNLGNVDRSLTPITVSASGTKFDAAHVVWGGVIVAIRNQPAYTELEVLAYPLDDSQQPDTTRAAEGRFLARYPHYLEAIDYAPGRMVTIAGTVEKVLAGKVGDAPYTFPLLKADAVYLWPRTTAAPSSPQFHFGVGVIFGG